MMELLVLSIAFSPAVSALISVTITQSFWFSVVPARLAGVGIVMFTLLWIWHELRLRWSRRSGEQVEFAVVAPDHAPPVVAAEIIENVPARSVLPAELIHLAVQRSIQIGQVVKSPDPTASKRDATFTQRTREFAKLGPHFSLLLRSRSQQHAIEEQLVRELFNPPVTGAKRTLAEGKNSELSRSLAWVFQQRTGFLLQQRLQTVRGRGSVFIGAIVGILMFLTACVLALVPAQQAGDRGTLLSLVASLIVGIVVGAFAVRRFSLPYLTPQGAYMRERLLALKRFILLEPNDRELLLQERTRALFQEDKHLVHSAEDHTDTEFNAAQDSSDPHAFFMPDPSDIIAIYERILPYAMLFRLRDRWVSALVDEYRKFGLTPDWITDEQAPAPERIPLFISSLSHTLQGSLPSVTGGGPANFNSA
ncbi:MAG: DUF2207 family protein [Canibacter sp.]